MRVLSYIVVGAMICACCTRTVNKQQSNADSAQEKHPGPGAAPETAQVKIWFTNLLSPLAPMRDSAYRAIRETASQSKADSLVARFRVRYSHAIATVDDSLFERESFQSWLQDDPDAELWVRSTIAPLGCDLVQSEGNEFLDAASGDLLKNLSERISPAMVSFLSIRADEEAECFSDDASLLISWDRLSDRIAKWESFMATNSSFLLMAEAESQYDMYLRAYLTGMDNSRVFDFDGDSINPGVLASYRLFLQKYQTTKTAEVVRDYLQELQRENFKHSDAIDDYLKSHGIRTMLAIQPPLR